ncbi:hypothetical protein [Streptomyces sp. NPDC050504]|uniref:hypothetical protein n=1 Tax=Streptomyces sp. NPDC050504 TaxID=3365618 RepID=UPI0037A614B9
MSGAGADSSDRDRPAPGLPDYQRRAIDAIVHAVAAGEHWRVAVLLERFVVDADMTALYALREALSQAVTRRDRRRD